MGIHTARDRANVRRMAALPREAAWLEFKAMNDQPNIPECPFCGIHHEHGPTHPHCDMATRFKFIRGEN